MGGAWTLEEVGRGVLETTLACRVKEFHWGPKKINLTSTSSYPQYINQLQQQQ